MVLVFGYSGLPPSFRSFDNRLDTTMLSVLITITVSTRPPEGKVAGA